MLRPLMQWASIAASTTMIVAPRHHKLVMPDEEWGPDGYDSVGGTGPHQHVFTAAGQISGHARLVTRQRARAVRISLRQSMVRGSTPMSARLSSGPRSSPYGPRKYLHAGDREGREGGGGGGQQQWVYRGVQQIVIFFSPPSLLYE